MATTGTNFQSGPNLRVRISADLADIKSGLGLLRGELAKVKRQADVSFGNQNALVNGLRQARQQLVGFVGAYLSLRGARMLGGIADEAKLLRGRSREAKGDYEAILELAQRTRTGLAGTVDLYARLERSTRAQRFNQQQLLELTESINKAVQLSFTTAASGEAALFQLGQGLGAGALRGEELNSVMEQTPRLAQAIADGLGVPIGKLRELAKEGKLTTEAVLAALESQTGALASEFSRLPVTIGAAMTQIRNAFVDYIGDVDEATGASARLAATLQEVARDLPRYLDPLLTAIRTLIENLDVLIVYLGTRLAAGAVVAAIAGFARLRLAIQAVTTATITLRTALLSLGGPVGIAVAALAAGIYYLYKRTNEARQAKELLNQRLAENEKLARASAQAALADAANQRKNALETLGNARAQLELKRARLANEIGSLSSVGAAKDSTGFRLGRMGRGVQQAQGQVDEAMRQVDAWSDQVAKLTVQVAMGWREASNAAAAAGTATADAGDKGKKAIKGMVDALELLQDAARRALAELERRFEAGELGIAEYFARKRDAELAAIDLAIRQAQEEARVAKTSEQQSKALTEIIKLQRDRAEIGPRVAREQAAAEREVNAALEQLRIRLLEAQGQDFKAAAERIRAEFRDVIAKLPLDMRPVGQAIVDQIIPLELSKARLQSFQSEMQDAMGQLRAAETSISAQQQAGMLGVAEAERQMQDVRGQTLDQLRQLRESVMAYYEATKDPTVIPFLQELNGNIAQVVSSQDKLRQQAADQAINSLTNFFTDLATGAKSAKDALRDFVLSFVQGMAQIAARALATFLILKAFDAIWPGFANFYMKMSSAGVLHGGGIAGSGGRIRTGLSPLLFGLAPRYHAGGIAGLAPNEVPAVLERGEEVLTKRDPRHRFNMEGGSRTANKTVILFDADAVANHMTTAAGESAVLEVIGRNPSRIREILA